MGQHSDLSARLPANLPLDNIADYQYAADTAATTSIAPSLFQDKTLPELPQIADFAAGPTKFEPTALEAKIGQDWGDDAPPPPPQSSLELESPQAMEVENMSSPPMPPPPMMDSKDGMPPPPPPPDAASSPELEPEAAAPPLPPDVMIQEEAEAPAPPGPRASLLDAIRNPGNLVKLRKVKEQEALEEREEAKATVRGLIIST